MFDLWSVNLTQTLLGMKVSEHVKKSRKKNTPKRNKAKPKGKKKKT